MTWHPLAEAQPTYSPIRVPQHHYIPDIGTATAGVAKLRVSTAKFETGRNSGQKALQGTEGFPRELIYEKRT